MTEPTIGERSAAHRLRDRSAMLHKLEHQGAWSLCSFEPCPSDRQAIEFLLDMTWDAIRVDAEYARVEALGMA